MSHIQRHLRLGKTGASILSTQSMEGVPDHSRQVEPSFRRLRGFMGGRLCRLPPVKAVATWVGAVPSLITQNAASQPRIERMSTGRRRLLDPSARPDLIDKNTGQSFRNPAVCAGSEVAVVVDLVKVENAITGLGLQEPLNVEESSGVF